MTEISFFLKAKQGNEKSEESEDRKIWAKRGRRRKRHQQKVRLKNTVKRSGGHKRKEGGGRACLSSQWDSAGCWGDGRCELVINGCRARRAVKRCGIRGHAATGGPPLTGSTDSAPLSTTSTAQPAFHLAEGCGERRGVMGEERWGRGR